MDDLLAKVEAIAVERYDGHLTVFRFTTHWKAMFGTLELYGGDCVGSNQVHCLPTFPTLEAALAALIFTSDVA